MLGLEFAIMTLGQVMIAVPGFALWNLLDNDPEMVRPPLAITKSVV